jgi:gamma-glutamylcyclotransferase (GGCT)/AIG2-like uncharacterized protein YtfP
MPKLFVYGTLLKKEIREKAAKSSVGYKKFTLNRWKRIPIKFRKIKYKNIIKENNEENKKSKVNGLLLFNK